jgi:hypothetical protein
MIPQGSVVFPTTTFDALTAQVNNVTSCEGLQQLTVEALASITGVKDAIDAQVAAVEPMLTLLIPPIGTPVQLVIWITSLIDNVLKPLFAPYENLIAQQAAVAAAVANLTAAIEAKAAQFETCSITVPPL